MSRKNNLGQNGLMNCIASRSKHSYWTNYSWFALALKQSNNSAKEELEGKYTQWPNPQKAENHACDRQSG